VFDFTWMNLIRVIAGAGSYLVPVAVMALTVRLEWLCAGLVLLRAASVLAYWLRCRRHFRMHGDRPLLDAGLARTLLGYGGWITVSNIVSPVMANLDRFLVAGAISVVLAGYYSSSQEVVIRFQIIPAAILSVLFPAIARSHASDPARAGDIFIRGTQYVTYALLPLAAACVLFAHEGLRLWMGPELADHAFRIMQVLAIGSFVNCLALNPFTFLQGIGRPDVTAKIHLVELPLYLGLLWVLTTRWGVTGVAVAWSVRMALDLVVLLVATQRVAPAMSAFVRRAAGRMVVPVAMLTALLALDGTGLRSAALAAVAALSAWALVREWRSGEIRLHETEPKAAA
jgi:O-antigen/teichoic acid export membrane protein